MHASQEVRPITVEQLRDLVRRATAEGQAIYPLGGRTMLDFGMPPTRPGIAIDLTALDQVIDYPARDMTITVQAGITIAKLQELLAKENQRLPVDVPLPERATLGGAIACNVSGPRRYGYGTLRDYVIGISVVNDRGEEVKAGGRVVKNVAGYDMCKLYTGSLGTLGIISQVTLKVRPRPEDGGVLCVGCHSNTLELLERVHQSQTRPVCVELLNQARVRGMRLARPDIEQVPWLVVVGFEGNRETIRWEWDQFMREMGAATHELDICCVAYVGERLSIGDLGTIPEARLSFKANLLPSAVAAFCKLADSLAMEVQLQAHAGNGIVLGYVQSETCLDEARSTIRALRRHAAEMAGSLILTHCPDEWKAELGVWGERRGDWELMRAVKRQLDPQNLFNPGRFVHDI